MAVIYWYICSIIHVYLSFLVFNYLCFSRVLLYLKVHVLWADLESAEWRVLESWVQDGTLIRIRQLILTVHLQWAGFEVGGAEADVVRFWYSVLSALHSTGFRLTHSTPGPGHTVLRQELPNTHSSYKLTWIRMGEQFK